MNKMAPIIATLAFIISGCAPTIPVICRQQVLSQYAAALDSDDVYKAEIWYVASPDVTRAHSAVRVLVSEGDGYKWYWVAQPTMSLKLEEKLHRSYTPVKVVDWDEAVSWSKSLKRR